jgi:NTP pyrophosphatase (non-canonical NTP hydrolase)
MSDEKHESRECTQAEVAVMFDAAIEFIERVSAERARQDRKWGRNFVGIDRMLVVLGEEIGEVCRAHLESSRNTGRASIADLEEEIIQSAAVLSKLYELLKAGAR